MESSPPDVFGLIFAYLIAGEILRLRVVSQTLRHVVDCFISTYKINREGDSRVCIDGNHILPFSHPRAAFSLRMNAEIYPHVDISDLLRCHALGFFDILGLLPLPNDTIMDLMASGHNTVRSCSFYASRPHFVPNDRLAMAMCNFPRDVLLHMMSLLKKMHANKRLSEEYTLTLFHQFFDQNAMHNPALFGHLIIGRPGDRSWACRWLLQLFMQVHYSFLNPFHLVNLHQLVKCFTNIELVPIVQHLLTRGISPAETIFIGIGYLRGVAHLDNLVALSKVGLNAAAASRANTARDRALAHLAHCR
jgi:hypothetical protein